MFFGDHQPALTDAVYEQIFGSDTLTAQQSEAKYVTPYLIWSNYSRETCGRPYMNAGYLHAVIKAEAGLSITQWDRYMLQMLQKYPVIGNYGIYDSGYAFQTYGEAAQADQDWLRQMKYAQYYWWTYKP